MAASSAVVRSGPARVAVPFRRLGMLARAGGARVVRGVRRIARPLEPVAHYLLSPVTPAGWAIGAVAFLAWVGAWALGWLELAYVAGGCGLAFVVAYAFTLGQAKLDVDLAMHPNRVVVGERAGG